MNRSSIGPLCSALILGAVATACAPAGPTIDLGDAEDYIEFLEERAEEEAPEPFDAEPLLVNARGEVRAAPDIAVITAVIRGEDENESRALEQMGGRINAVQAALSGAQVETGFTAITSQPRYDEACQNENAAARQRHSQIQSDYWFNRNLDQRGDTETRRRPPRPRVKQIVCQAQTIRVETQMVARIAPADAAGDVLRALSDAGAHRADLYGYDFSDYDALYQEAAERAMRQARAKAIAVADGAGGTLGEIVSMSISAPSRTGRFGPQPAVVRPKTPYAGEDGSALERYRFRSRLDTYAPSPPPPVSYTRPDGSIAALEDEVVVTASRQGSGYTYAEPVVVQEASVELVQTPDGLKERVIPAVTKTVTRRQEQSNALTMSLMSGPQIIEARATLAFDYATPLDGKIIIEPEEG